MKPNALVESTAVLRSVLDEFERRRDGRRDVFSRDHFSSGMMLRHEEMQADDLPAATSRQPFRPRRAWTVRREDALGLTTASSLAKTSF